jgi:hypothetical protein
MNLEKKITIHAKEAYLIKKSDLSLDCIDAIKNKYTLKFYEESACKKCEFLQDRHSEICDNCAGFLGGVAMAKDIKVGNNAYISSPIGDGKGLKSILVKHGLSNFKLVKHYPNVDFKKPIEFTGTFRPMQEDAVDACISGKQGILLCPPRSGKTLMFSVIACRIGKKTIILASQTDWLQGFYETFVGSKTQPALTSAVKDQVGFCKTYEDFVKYDVCLATVQTFYSDGGKKLLSRIKNMFTVLGIDEIHTGAAATYASTISKFNCAYRIGLTGTNDRKDFRWPIASNLIGPVLYEMKIERLKPTIRLVRTEYRKVYKGNVPWVNVVKALECDPKRLKLIAEWAIKDVADGHMVIIPLTQVKSIEELIKIINKLSGKALAYPFFGGAFLGRNKVKRDQTIEDARNYKIKIIVGNARMLSTGINIPRASMIYDVTPSSNIPAATQRVSRILTPYENKPQPILRIFLDDFNIRKNCLRNEFFQCFKPVFKVVVSDKDNEVLKQYFKAKREVFDEQPIF